MATVLIQNLTAATTGAELIPLVQGGPLATSTMAEVSRSVN